MGHLSLWIINAQSQIEKLDQTLEGSAIRDGELIAIRDYLWRTFIKLSLQF